MISIIKRANIFTRLSLSLVLLSSVVTICTAYVLSPYKWPLSADTFYVQWDSGGTYDSAFIEAMNKWNGLSDFVYTADTSRFVDPCNSVSSPDFESGYRFSPDDCGRGFGASTLAVAWTWSSGSTIVDSDIIFNSNRTWGVHDLPTTTQIDFRRVAVHELGHSLGLGHEPTNPAIMNPIYSTTILGPQADDINGIVAQYGKTVTDTDGDGITDDLDNCTLVANPLQQDTDGDNYGNRCDADFDNNQIINAADLFYLKSNFLTADPDADLNSDGVVNASDLFILKSMFLLPPGPSCCAP